MLIVNDQIAVYLNINGKDIPLGPSTFSNLSIIQNMNNLTGVAQCGITDINGYYSQGLFSDQAPVKFGIGPAIGGQGPIPANFRLFNILDATPTTAGISVTFTANYDSPEFFRKTMTKAYKGTSASVITQIGGEFGIPVETTGTADSQVWLPNNRPYGQSMRDIADHGYASNTSAMHLSMGTRGDGKWQLIYKDVMSQLKQDAKDTFISLNMYDPSSRYIPILTAKQRSHAGTLNNKFAYGANVMQTQLDGKTAIESKVEAIQAGISMSINSAIQGIVGSLSHIVMPHNQANCQSGATLIPTEQGLLRLDSLLQGRQQRRDINFLVGSRYEPRYASTALYSGRQQTYIVLSKKGYRLICTDRHPNLIFNIETGETEWRPTYECKTGDLLVANPNQPTRQVALNLNLIGPEVEEQMGEFGYGNKGRFFKKPKIMTPALAKLLAYTVSEGHFTDKRLIFTNSNREVMKDFQRCLRVVIGKKYPMKLNKVVLGKINGVQVKTAKNCWTIDISSVLLIDYLRQLGCYEQKGKRNGKKASYFKVIPWSILEADRESQNAFLAAYIEGDGCIDNSTGRIIYFSASKYIMRSLQILLASHGIFCNRTNNEGINRITISAEMSAKLWPNIEKYMVSKFLEPLTCQKYTMYGVPGDYWRNLLSERLVEINNTSQGNAYINDKGEKVYVSWKDENGKSMQHIYQASQYQYSKYKRGIYNLYLKKLKIISKNGYKKLKKLLELEYLFDPIEAITKHKVIDVYDIQMEKGEPAFIANGLVVHNTHDNFQKARLQNEKLKATLSKFLTIYTHFYTDVQIMDPVDVIIGNGTDIDRQMSGRYLVHSRTQYINSQIYREMLVLSSQ